MIKINRVYFVMKMDSLCKSVIKNRIKKTKSLKSNPLISKQSMAQK